MRRMPGLWDLYGIKLIPFHQIIFFFFFLDGDGLVSGTQCTDMFSMHRINDRWR